MSDSIYGNAGTHPKRLGDTIQSELATGLEQRLYTVVKDWIAQDWPLRAVAFPGRDIGWDAWRALADD